jgi:16S rRNA (guanine527-N7)-methyltransferase
MIPEYITEEQIAFLQGNLEERNIPFSERMTETLFLYMDMALEYNKNINLTTITEPDEFIEKHFLDSLFCYGWDEIEEAKDIVDVGTGAGFPGIPLALAYPWKNFVLMDSLGKRVTFIESAIEALEIPNATAVHIRAEDAGRSSLYRERFDLCVSRALARLPVLCEYCLPLVKTGGFFYAYKTDGAAAEIPESEAARKLLGAPGEVVLRAEERKESKYRHNIMVLRKEKPTPKTYPRKAGTPAKVPL